MKVPLELIESAPELLDSRHELLEGCRTFAETRHAGLKFKILSLSFLESASYLLFYDGTELFYGDLHVPKYHFAHKESKDPVNFSHDPSFTMELKP